MSVLRAEAEALQLAQGLLHKRVAFDSVLQGRTALLSLYSGTEPWLGLWGPTAAEPPRVWLPECSEPARASAMSAIGATL